MYCGATPRAFSCLPFGVKASGPALLLSWASEQACTDDSIYITDGGWARWRFLSSRSSQLCAWKGKLCRSYLGHLGLSKVR